MTEGDNRKPTREDEKKYGRKVENNYEIISISHRRIYSNDIVPVTIVQGS